MEQAIEPHGQPERRAYTAGEEIFNAVSHGIGALFAAAILTAGVIKARSYGAYYVVGMAVYGASMLLVYTMSTLYHALKQGAGKRVLRVFDHCMIFLLIAGTYTPICLGPLCGENGAWGWALFASLWFLALIGIALNAVAMNKKAVKVFSYSAYFVMGWSALIAIVPILKAMPLAGFLWILGGGLAYTFGIIFYAVGRKKKYMHSVWHLFVLAGSALQFVGIIAYVVA